MVDVRHYLSATALLRHRAATRAADDALIWVRDGESDRMSYAELDERARRIATWLTARLPRGSRVLLLYPPVEFVVAFVGCLYAGMVAVPAPLPGRYPHERRRVRAIARDAGVGAILTAAVSEPVVAEWALAEGLGDVELLVTDRPGYGEPAGWTMPDVDGDSLALLQYTSGSTGDPKGVMVSHRNLLVNASTMYLALGVAEDCRFGGWAPQFHDMGLMAQTLPALFLGTACVLMDPTAFLRRPYHWLRMISDFRVNWSAAPNFAYELCRRRVTEEQLAELDLSHWRHAVNGSEPVQVSTVLDFAERFAAAGFSAGAAAPCYGLAEATVFVSGAPARPPVITAVDAELLERHEFRPTYGAGRRLASNGAARLFDVVVVDPASRRRQGPGQVGEIWLRGENVARGYWRNDAATEATFRAVTADGDGGYLRTGDLGVVHDGEIYVTGRLKETLIIHGRNIYPQDVEHELRLQHPELGNVGAVFTVSAGDEEVLVVTHEVQGLLDRDALGSLSSRMKQTVAREFGVHPAAVSLVRRGGVRRTTSGKIQRTAMRDLFVAAELESEYADVDRRLLPTAPGELV